jgi:hypothetical protein
VARSIASRRPTTNGHKPAEDRKRPVRTITVTLDGDYAGTTLQMRSNLSLGALDELEGMTDLAEMRRRVAGLIVEHNFVDERGALLKLDEQCSQLTLEEFYAALRGYYRAIYASTALPKGDAASSVTTTPSST